MEFQLSSLRFGLKLVSWNMCRSFSWALSSLQFVSWVYFFYWFAGLIGLRAYLKLFVFLLHCLDFIFSLINYNPGKYDRYQREYFPMEFLQRFVFSGVLVKVGKIIHEILYWTQITWFLDARFQSVGCQQKGRNLSYALCVFQTAGVSP